MRNFGFYCANQMLIAFFILHSVVEPWEMTLWDGRLLYLLKLCYRASLYESRCTNLLSLSREQSHLSPDPRSRARCCAYCSNIEKTNQRNAISGELLFVSEPSPNPRLCVYDSMKLMMFSFCCKWVSQVYSSSSSSSSSVGEWEKAE